MQLTANHRGFTMVEVVVVLATLAVLVALIALTLLPRIRQGESAALAESLRTISTGILEYRTDVRRHPRRVSALTTAPVAGTTDNCNQTVPTALLGLWQGPYLRRDFTAAGMKIAEATVQDTIGRSPTPFASTTNGFMVIVATDVDSATARRVEAVFEPTADFAAGTIRWVNVTGGRGTMSYYLPARGC